MVPPPYQVLNPQVQAQTDRAVAQIEATVPYPLSTLGSEGCQRGNRPLRGRTSGAPCTISTA